MQQLTLGNLECIYMAINLYCLFYNSTISWLMTQVWRKLWWFHPFQHKIYVIYCNYVVHIYIWMNETTTMIYTSYILHWNRWIYEVYFTCVKSQGLLPPWKTIFCCNGSQWEEHEGSNIIILPIKVSNMDENLTFKVHFCLD